LFISLPNINRFLKFFQCYTEQEICNKKIIADPTTPKKFHYITLQNISFSTTAQIGGLSVMIFLLHISS